VVALEERLWLLLLLCTTKVRYIYMTLEKAFSCRLNSVSEEPGYRTAKFTMTS
jgi:hypothetical protein